MVVKCVALAFKSSLRRKSVPPDGFHSTGAGSSASAPGHRAAQSRSELGPPVTGELSTALRPAPSCQQPAVATTAFRRRRQHGPDGPGGHRRADKKKDREMADLCRERAGQALRLDLRTQTAQRARAHARSYAHTRPWHVQRCPYGKSSQRWTVAIAT